ncbi:MAG: DUF3857 domain-containing protein [Bacteroidales bacterium]|nr:DUF3857 domain-containing protein [Bacteroidales bacterium]
MRYFLLLVILFLQLFAISQEKYDAEVLQTHSNTIVDKKSHNLTVNYLVKILINNRDGEDYAHVVIPFYMEDEKPKNIEAVVTDVNGNILQKLKKKDINSIENTSDEAFHDDTKKVYFFMGQNKFPYILTYSYEQTISNYFDLVPDIKYFNGIPAKKIIVKASVPIDFSTRYKTAFMDSVKIDTINNHVYFNISGHYTKVIKPEVYTNPDSVPLPTAYIIPQEFKYGRELSQKTWKDLGQWQYNLLKNLNELPFDEQQKISQLVAGIHDTTEIIKTLYHYLQDQTRYVNVAIKRGRLKPYPASYVAENKYGDCKALSNYFKSLLDFVGIPSAYAIIRAGTKFRKIDRNLPTPQFNHAIIYIPRKDSNNIWLDCTSKLAFGYVGTFIQNRNALVIENNASKLIKTPALTPQKVLTTRKAIFNYDLNSTASADISYKFRGMMYQNLYYTKRENNALDNKYIMKYLISKGGFTMDKYTLTQPDRDSAFMVLHFDAHSNNIYKKFGNDILVVNFNIITNDLERPKNRKVPIDISYPDYMIDSITYNIPEDYKISGMRNDTTINTKFGEYSIKLIQKNSAIMVVKKYLLNSGNYPLSEYSKLYRFIKDIYKSESKVIVVLTRKNQ